MRISRGLLFGRPLFCVIGNSLEFPITQKNRHTFLYNGLLYIPSKLHTEFLLLLSFILQEITSSYLSLTITFWLSPRPISNSQLHVLLRFHLCPIYLVVFKGSYYLRMGYLILRGASRLDAFSVYPVPTWLLGHEIDSQPMHQRSVHPGPLVLRTAPLRYPTPTPCFAGRSDRVKS